MTGLAFMEDTTSDIALAYVVPADRIKSTTGCDWDPLGAASIPITSIIEISTKRPWERIKSAKSTRNYITKSTDEFCSLDCQAGKHVSCFRFVSGFMSRLIPPFTRKMIDLCLIGSVFPEIVDEFDVGFPILLQQRFDRDLRAQGTGVMIKGRLAEGNLLPL